MPFTGNEYEYSIPQEYKSMISVDLLKTFRSELVFALNFDLYSLNYEIFTSLISSGVLEISFKTACEKMAELKLLNYYKSLPWFDVDLFLEQTIDLMLAKSLIAENHPLTYMQKELKITEDSIGICHICSKQFLKEHLFSLNVTHEDNTTTEEYICNECNKK